MLIRRCVVPTTVLAVASLLLAGCGSSTKKASTSATTAASTTTTAATSIGVATDAKLGQILVDGSGRTLYHFSKDTGTTIACTGDCATTWPPLLAPADGLPTTGPAGGTLGTVARPVRRTPGKLPKLHRPLQRRGVEWLVQHRCLPPWNNVRHDASEGMMFTDY